MKTCLVPFYDTCPLRDLVCPLRDLFMAGAAWQPRLMSPRIGEIVGLPGVSDEIVGSSGTFLVREGERRCDAQ